MAKKCPYCNSVINETDDICSVCNRDLNVQCPYCKQTIKVYDEICPQCSSILHESKWPKALIIAGLLINFLWISGNILGLYIIAKFPQIFTLSGDESVDLVLNIGRLSSGLLVFVAIPYIISIIKKYKVKFAIAGLITNFILAIVFILCLAVLYATHA